MTIKEAMENIALCVHYAMSDYNTSPDEDSEDEESLSMAIEAMKKQMPVEPSVTFYPDGSFIDVCSVCSEALSENFVYCPDCGQKIDWVRESD